MKKIALIAMMTLGFTSVSAMAGSLGQELGRVQNAFADWSGANPLVFTPATDIGEMYRIQPDRVAYVVQMEYQKLGYGQLNGSSLLQQINKLRQCHQEDSSIDSVSDALETLGQPKTVCNGMTTGLIAQAVLAAETVR